MTHTSFSRVFLALFSVLIRQDWFSLNRQWVRPSQLWNKVDTKMKFIKKSENIFSSKIALFFIQNHVREFWDFLKQRFFRVFRFRVDSASLIQKRTGIATLISYKEAFKATVFDKRTRTVKVRHMNKIKLAKKLVKTRYFHDFSFVLISQFLFWFCENSKYENILRNFQLIENRIELEIYFLATLLVLDFYCRSKNRKKSKRQKFVENLTVFFTRNSRQNHTQSLQWMGMWTACFFMIFFAQVWLKVNPG